MMLADANVLPTLPLAVTHEECIVDHLMTASQAARRLGVSWSPNLDHALSRAKEIVGEHDVVGLTMPPFFYVNVGG